jgi:hypothetical protein
MNWKGSADSYSADTEFELKKDVVMPNGYIKAGEIKKKSDWERLFPKSFHYGFNEWFIPVKQDAVPSSDTACDNIVNKVFAEKGLYSLAYKQAAKECIKIYNETINWY